MVGAPPLLDPPTGPALAGPPDPLIHKPRPSVSAWVYLALCLIGIGHEFWLPPGWEIAALVLAVLFLALEFRATGRMQRVAGYLLAAGGIAFGIHAGQGWEVVLDGTARSLKFLVMFSAVAWLQVPAMSSPTLMAARQFVIDQPSGRRFLMLAYAAHILGAFLNLAALTLLSGMVARADDRQLKDRLAVALMVGFTSASAWSPFYVSVTVVLAALPSLKWADIALPGLITGLTVVAVTALLDRIFERGSRPLTPKGPEVQPGSWPRLATLLLSLMILVIVLETQFHLSIPIILGILAPPYALIWLSMSPILRPQAPGLVRRVVTSLPNLRGEALIFIGANLFGTGVSRALDPAATASLLHIGSWPDFAKPLALAWFIIVVGGIGLHPVVLVILVGSVLPPAVFGMPPLVMALVMLGTWGLSTTSSPFSGTTLVVGRLTGEDSFRLAWKRAPLYTLSGGTVVAIGAYVFWKGWLGG